MLMDFIFPLILSGLLGAIIGFDREKIAVSKRKFNFAGIRTSSLISILGFLIIKIDKLYSPVGILFLLSFLLALVGSFLINVYKNQESGATSEIAIMINVIIGILCANTLYFESLILSLLTVLVLSFKQSIHLFVEKISSRDFPERETIPSSRTAA